MILYQELGIKACAVITHSIIRYFTANDAIQFITMQKIFANQDNGRYIQYKKGIKEIIQWYLS